jgi:hypothetical protein
VDTHLIQTVNQTNYCRGFTPHSNDSGPESPPGGEPCNDHVTFKHSFLTFQSLSAPGLVADRCTSMTHITGGLPLRPLDTCRTPSSELATVRHLRRGAAEAHNQRSLEMRHSLLSSCRPPSSRRHLAPSCDTPSTRGSQGAPPRSDTVIARLAI